MTDEACARRTIFSAFRTAALDLWGEEGLEKIGAEMPSDCADETVRTIVVSRDWLPERYVMAWYETVYAGPCERQNKAFATFLDRMMDAGFGRVRKFLLGVATPAMLIGKAASLWRHDHTHGDLSAVSPVPGRIDITLENHVYTSTPLARMAIAEIYRYAFSLCRVRDVTTTHALQEDESLIVHLAYR